jgi:low temperature requirement protein LtrA
MTEHPTREAMIWARPMTGRDPNEAHRASTPLELFVDLAFVVAIAQCVASLHHGLVEGHIAASIEAYPMVFFAIWWAWMNFTWFASAYDTDDAMYRVAVFCQMAGVLILAAGVPRAFAEGKFAVVTIGYLVMRVGLVSQWIRVARSKSATSASATRYAIGLPVLQIGWIALLWVDAPYARPCFAILVMAELFVPFWAERSAGTSWHPEHIAERYGLFTIIVLGESVLSATLGVQGAIDSGGAFRDLGAIIAGGFLIMISMWWFYFDQPSQEVTEHIRSETDALQWTTFVWGYGHVFVFATVAATGASLAVAVDGAIGHSELNDWQTALSTTVPVSMYVVTLWVLHAQGRKLWWRNAKPPAIALLVLASTWLPEPVLGVGVVLAAAVATNVVSHHRSELRRLHELSRR